ncbi:MAG: hypothetical protein AAF513_10790 [Pseudomonadota bacterium]
MKKTMPRTSLQGYADALKRWVAVLSVGATCVLSSVAVQSESNQETPTRTVDELLQEVVTTQEGQRCLALRQIKRFEIMNTELLLMHGRADKMWVSKMPKKCSALRKNMLVSLELFGSQICKNDRFKAQDRGFTSGFFTTCRLGSFEPVTTEQVVMLRQSLAP